MSIIRTIATLTALAFAVAGVTATSASADLHETPFHGTQVTGTFTGPGLGLTCHDSSFEGEITDGAWDETNAAEGVLHDVAFEDCEPDPPCTVTVRTPVDIHISQNGHVDLEDVHVLINCSGNMLEFAADEVEGQWDCNEPEGTLTFTNQEFYFVPVPTVMAFWTSEWDIHGLEAERACA